MPQPKTSLVTPLWPQVTPRAAKPKGKKTAAGTVQKSQIESGEELVICNDPPPAAVLGPRGSKYTAKFESLPVGQGLICSNDKVWPTAVAMRAWLKRTGRNDLIVVSKKNYKDGKGRVWLVKKT